MKTRFKTLKNRLLKFYKCEVKQFNKIFRSKIIPNKNLKKSKNNKLKQK